MPTQQKKLDLYPNKKAPIKNGCSFNQTINTNYLEHSTRVTLSAQSKYTVAT